MRDKTVAGAAAVVASVALALSGCGSGGHRPKVKTTVRAGVAPIPPQREGAYFGASVDPVGALADFEHAMGRPVDIAQTYRDWDKGFPLDSDTSLLNSGRTVLLTLTGGDSAAIVSGTLDNGITAKALAIKKTGKPIFLRWQPDMDTAKLRRTVHSASSFVLAWKRLRQLFHSAGAENVAWVWCPSARGFGVNAADGTATETGTAGDYYPGDDQVDWICTDANPDAKNPANTLAQILKPFMDWSVSHPKPIMIGEFGVPKAYGAQRPAWLRKAAQTLQNSQVKAVVYEDTNAHGGDYSLSGDDAAMSAVRELATSPFFNPRNLPVQTT